MKSIRILFCLHFICLEVCSQQVKDSRYMRQRNSVSKEDPSHVRMADTNSQSRSESYRQIIPVTNKGADTVVPAGRTQVIITKTKLRSQAVYFVYGTVNTPSGAPVPGFDILLQGTVSHATTDNKGNFTIPFKKGGILEFSHPGYVTIVTSPETDPNFTNRQITISMKIRVLEDEIKTTAPKVTLDVFPIPFPTPSGIYDLSPATFYAVNTLGGVDGLLRQALDNCRYDEKRYYYAPHGFALVTEMEQTNAEGVSMDPPERWSVHISEQLNNPVEYIKAFFSVPAGYFRVFVFLVTDADVYASGSGIDEDDARKWLDQGYSSLPNDLKQTPITASYSYTLLVYQYKKRSGETGEKYTGISARDNFIQSRLSTYLALPKK